MPLYDKVRKKKIYPFVRNKADGNRLKTIYSFFKQHSVMVEKATGRTPQPPSVFSISPASVPAAGGTAMKALGVGFTGTTTVKISSSPDITTGTVISFVVDSDSQISFTSIAGISGFGYYVHIITPLGNATGNFVYT